MNKKQKQTQVTNDEVQQEEPTERTVDDMAELEAALAEAKEKQLRTMADFENYRRRMDAEKSKYGLMANKMLVDSILEVLDDVQMARNDDQLDIERATELLSTFSDKLISTLRINGVERIEIKKGDAFNSEYMEAITTIPGEEDNKVVDIVSGAYKYANKDELLKTAKVVVSKKQA